jgi:hypothetical protein
MQPFRAGLAGRFCGGVGPVSDGLAVAEEFVVLVVAAVAAADVVEVGDELDTALLRNGGRPGLDRVVPRSDGEGEFGEGDREPMLWVLIYAEFVVATSEVLHEGVSGADHSDRAQPFKTAHHP